MIRRRVEHWALVWDLPAATLIDLQLALGEAAANGVEHAYPDGRTGTVEVELDIRHVDRTSSVIMVRVTDRGRWRPVPTHPGYRGRGLMMIERLARHVEVLRSAHGTEVCFEIPLPR